MASRFKPALLSNSEWEYVAAMQVEFNCVFGSRGDCLLIRPIYPTGSKHLRPRRYSKHIKYASISMRTKKEIVDLKSRGINYRQICFRYDIESSTLRKILHESRVEQ